MRKKGKVLLLLTTILLILGVFEISGFAEKLVHHTTKAVHKQESIEQREESGKKSDEKVKQEIAKEQERKEEAKAEQEKKEEQQKKEEAARKKAEEKRKEEHSNGGQTTESLAVGKVVYLTFDDGPGPKVSELLDLLNKYQAKATFFMLEPHMNQYSTALNRMRDQGHALAVHSVTHNVSQVYASPASFVDEMQTAINRVAEITGVNTRLIRAPYGSKPYLTEPFQAAINKKQFIYWDWNIDSLDWKKTDGSFVAYTINQIENLVGKEPLVVLMHDKSTTVDSIEPLLQYLQANGYEMRAINEQMKPMQF